MALQDFHQKHFRNVIDLLGGGMVKQYLEICNEVKRITDMLVVGDLPPEQYDVLRKDRQALLEVVIRMYDRAVSAALVGAKVEFLRKHGTTGSGGGMKRAKPGFSPLKRSAAPEQDANISPPA
jgi:hypothetical protein